MSDDAKKKAYEDKFHTLMQTARDAYVKQEQAAILQLPKGHKFYWIQYFSNQAADISSLLGEIPGAEAIAIMNILDKDSVTQISDNELIMKVMVGPEGETMFLRKVGLIVSRISSKIPYLTNFDPVSFHITNDQSLVRRVRDEIKREHQDELEAGMAAIDKEFQPSWYERTIQPILDQLNATDPDGEGASKVAVLLAVPSALAVLLLVLFNR